MIKDINKLNNGFVQKITRKEPKYDTEEKKVRAQLQLNGCEMVSMKNEDETVRHHDQ